MIQKDKISIALSYVKQHVHSFIVIWLSSMHLLRRRNSKQKHKYVYTLLYILIIICLSVHVNPFYSNEVLITSHWWTVFKYGVFKPNLKLLHISDHYQPHLYAPPSALWLSVISQYFLDKPTVRKSLFWLTSQFRTRTNNAKSATTLPSPAFPLRLSGTWKKSSWWALFCVFSMRKSKLDHFTAMGNDKVYETSRICYNISNVKMMSDGIPVNIIDIDKEYTCTTRYYFFVIE